MTGYFGDGRGAASVPRSTRAADAAAVARVVRARGGRPAAWWGMLVLIASEATLFAVFIGTYYFLRFRAPAWPPEGIPEPELVAPLVLALTLALTSIPMQLASVAATGGRVAATRLWIVLALVVQSGYIAYQLHDFGRQLESFDATANAYGSIYYTLLGADHAHVLLGMLFSLWLLWKLARGLTTYRANAAQAITWYWHFANVITLAVTATLLSARA